MESVIRTALGFLADAPVRVAFVIAQQGVLLLIVGALAMVLGTRTPRRAGHAEAHWRWFGWFAMLKGVGLIGSLALGVAYSWRPEGFFSAIYLGINLFAWLAGAQFAWRCCRGWLPGAIGWAPLAAWAVAVGFAAMEGEAGFVFLHEVLAGLVGIAVMVALFQGTREASGRRTAAGALGIMLTLVGLGGLVAMEWAGPAYRRLMQGWTLNTLPDFTRRDFDPVFRSLGFAWAFGTGWWIWMWQHLRRGRTRGWLRRALWAIPPGLLAMCAAGFMAINHTKVAGNVRADRIIERRAENAALALRFAGGPSPSALAGLAAANPDIETIALVRMDGDRMVTSLSTSPGLPLPERPWLWREHGASDPRFRESRERFSSAFMQDRQGTFALYCEPFPAPGEGWLVMRVDYHSWAMIVGPVIEQTTYIILLAFVVVITASVLSIQREISAEARINFERADASSRAKTELLTRASHELRTPIQGVLGYADLLERSALGARQRGWVEALRGQGDHLLRLVNDLLDFGALQAGRVRLEEAPVSPVAVAGQALAAVRPQAEVNGLACALVVEDPVPAWVTGDATRLRQILLNLLGNAVKFTGRGKVTLEVRSRREVFPDGQEKSRLFFAVADTGPGIEPGEMAALFTPRGRARRHPAEGAGLGLALARSLCEAMGGDLQVESLPGHGSTFTASVVLEETVSPVTEPAQPVPAALAKRVLVVEDNTPLRLLLASWLDHLGCGSVLAADGESALEKVRIERFDAVILDLGLPGLDGFEVARRLCATSAKWGRPWIVGLSAHAGEAEREAALLAGMDRFLAKPIGLAELAAALRHGAPTAPAGASRGRLLTDAQIEAVWAAAIEETPVRVAALQMALDAGEWDKVAMLAHYLCNTADVLGIDALHDACLECEHAARSGRHTQAGQLAITIARLCEELARSGPRPAGRRPPQG